MRGMLSVLVLAAVIAGGAWYFLVRSDAPVETPPAAGAPGAGKADAGETAEPGAAVTDTAATAGATAAAGGVAEAEAKKYVETLTEPTSRPIPVEKADHFATPERVLSLVPEDAIEQTTLRELAGDASLDADTPLTVVREVEQLETLTPEQLIAESEGNFEATVRVLEEDDVRQTTVRELLERFSADPDVPLSIVKVVRHFEITTLGELLESGEDPEALLDVITQPYRAETATLAELLEQRRAMKPDSIFYLRTVRPTDEQGIWGIVHDGIIENFARGMAIRDGEEIETYTVHIPRESDEMSLDRTSSFLGRLIHRKTEESFVYNFRRNRMGHNPDRIYPGQEIVIIDFQPEELIAIYRHFKDSADGRG